MDEESAGTAYLIAFPDTTANALDARYPNTRGPRSEFTVWIYSAVKNKVRIIQGGGGTTVLDVPAGKFKIHNFTGSPVVTSINAKTNNTYRIESDFPIIIYCYLATIQGLEAWTPIPIDFWGTEYHSANVPGETVLEIGTAEEILIPHKVKMGSAEILMIAAYDNTRITLRPPPLVNFLGGPPRDITLNAGQAFQVQSIVDVDLEGAGQPDIAATVITSDKPIGVLSGNTRVQINYDETGLKNNAYKNMLMEWLTPSEQHGTQFVFMPTWDNVRPGSGAPAERKREYVRFYSTQGKDAPGYYLQPGGTTQVPFTAIADSLREFVFGNPAAVVMQTEVPSQALMHSSAIVKFNGSTPCFGGIPCLSYDAWAPYMVELTPREQWTTFAPYYAPVNPGGMLHYLNVVADTISAQNIYRESGSRFNFTRRIPGTDLIWGSIPVNPGQDNYLLGKNGARFFAFAYGIFKGFEEYRPGRTKKDDDDDDQHAIAGGGDNAPRVAHPCEYEEYNALSYGYPLAPTRKVLRPADSLQIDTVMDCTTLTIKARALNENPVGFRSVTLEPGSVKNARLVPVDPLRLSDIIGRTRIEIKVEPIDPLQNAEATVVLKDRTGKLWKVYYKYEAEYVTVDPTDVVNFGLVTLNTDAERTVTITNPLQKVVEVKEVRLALGNQGYTIVSTNPAGPLLVPPQVVRLGPGEKMTVVIRVRPTLENQLYVDSLKVGLSCTKVVLPLITETATPRIDVPDKHFGDFVIGDDPKIDSINICNIGGGELTFKNPNDPAVKALLEWLHDLFEVEESEIAKLVNAKLKANECIWIKIKFTPGRLGLHRTVARVWGSVRDRRDTSVWTANVVQPGPRITGYDWEDRWVTAKGTANCTKNGEPFYPAEIEISNSGTSPFRVKSLELVGPDAPFFELDHTSDPLKSVRVGDEFLPGASPRKQNVRFMPKDERDYSVIVRLTTETDEVVENFLVGTGIESHGSITNIVWAPQLLSTALGGQTLYATLRATPTRPLTVTDIVVDGVHAPDFTVDKGNITVNSVVTPLPFTLQPDQTAQIPVRFLPTTGEGQRDAFIRFVGDHSFCDDSSNTLSAYTYTLSVLTQGVDLGLACAAGSGEVTITNGGSEPVVVRGATMTNNTGLFTLPNGTTSVIGTLGANETKRLLVNFDRTRAGAGRYSESVSFDVVDEDGLPVTAAPVEVVGERYMHSVTAHIARTYVGQPGTTFTVPVMLNGDLSNGGIVPANERVTNFTLKLKYDRRMARLTNQNALASMLANTLLAGWNVVQRSSTNQPNTGVSEIELEFTSPDANTYLAGPGVLLNLQFLIFIGQVDSSQLDFSVTIPGNECLSVIPSPGLLRIDSVCGLNYRLIQAINPTTYTLDQNKPNPFNPTTKINFTLGLDGQTRLTIYDASGRKVATLLDGYMLPGAYEIPWDASGFPSGLYYYRLESGDWTKTNTMILRK